MDKTTIDLNATQCLVKQQGWGERIITNVCSGEVVTIPWTVGDWSSALLMCFFGFVVCCFALGVCAVIVSCVKDLLDG